MIDLRKEMESLLSEYGSYVLLIRKNEKIQCSCWKEHYKQPDSSCKICLGLGYLFNIERHLARSTVKSIPTNPLSSTSGPSQEIGDLLVPIKTFYFKHTAEPKQNDLIVECSWNDDVPVIDAYSKLYEIAYPEPRRSDTGRIEYFSVGCKSDPINAKIRIVDIARKKYLVVDTR